MNKSEAIRSLGKQKLPVAEIARRVGVRYQFVRNVLLRAGLLPKGRPRTGARSTSSQGATSTAAKTKPRLTVKDLLGAGFQQSSRWLLTSGERLDLQQPLPIAPGVYAMVKDGVACYVGLATIGIAKRFKFYVRPGKTQSTSIRINEILMKELRANALIDIYTASPPDLAWNGLPVSGIAGLELGLIEAYQLPWNVRNAKLRRS